MKRGSGRFSDQTTKRHCRVRYSYINRACTRRSVSKDRRYHCIHWEDHLQHEKTRDSISGCSVKNVNRAGSAKKQMQRELSSALVVPRRYLDSQRNERANRAIRPDIFGIVSLTSLVLKNKQPVDDDVDNQKKSTTPSFLPMLFGRQRERVSPTQMTQQERRRSSFSQHLGPRRFAETRVDGNRALKWNEIDQERGQGELVRPQSTSTQCPSMRERISHTQSTEFMRISRWPRRWLGKSKSALRLRLHGTGLNIMVRA